MTYFSPSHRMPNDEIISSRKQINSTESLLCIWRQLSSNEWETLISDHTSSCIIYGLSLFWGDIKTFSEKYKLNWITVSDFGNRNLIWAALRLCKREEKCRRENLSPHEFSLASWSKVCLGSSMKWISKIRIKFREHFRYDLCLIATRRRGRVMRMSGIRYDNIYT